MDEDEIKVMIDNLINNAVKYNSDKKIFISLEKVDENAVLCVKNGINCDVSDIDKIWDPFYVLEKSRSKELSGSGLGLSIVSEIANKYGFEKNVQVIGKCIKFKIVFKKNNNNPHL
ncbi:MAG: HAMP domain-containing histidine kinase [Clostridioides sp.]|nr:HAMP domain-containing histidine kinase [Clostridioides sp.]